MCLTFSKNKQKYTRYILVALYEQIVFIYLQKTYNLYIYVLYIHELKSEDMILRKRKVRFHGKMGGRKGVLM